MPLVRSCQAPETLCFVLLTSLCGQINVDTHLLQVLLLDECTVDLDVVARWASMRSRHMLYSLRTQATSKSNLNEIFNCQIHRLDLLEFFRRECEERGATIVYATHVRAAAYVSSAGPSDGHIIPDMLWWPMPTFRSPS